MMENKWKCEICDKIITKNNSYIVSHIKRKHNITLEEYLMKYYINNNPNFCLEKCGFCNNNAKYEIEINHDDKTYKNTIKNTFVVKKNVLTKFP